MSARQELIPEWDQERFGKAEVLLIGAGGIGGEIAEGLVLKGLGFLHICDHDIVTPSNLNRQKFRPRNLYRNKAVELCREMSRIGCQGTELRAHPCSFQELHQRSLRPHVVVCGVDNQVPDTRLEVCRQCYDLDIPGVFVAASRDADNGYILIQEPGSACWACIMKPEFASTERDDEGRCPNVPAVCDLLKALSGPALFGIDSLILGRPRNWNYRALSLRSDFGGSHNLEKRPGCPVCSQNSER